MCTCSLSLSATALVLSAEIYHSLRMGAQNSDQIMQLQLFPPKHINMSCNSSTLSTTSVFNYKLGCKKFYKVVIIICTFVYSCVKIEHERCGIKSLFSFFLANNIMITIFILPGQLTHTAVSFHYMETLKINKMLFHLLSWKTKYMWKDYKMSCDVLCYISCSKKWNSMQRKT